MFAIIRAFNWEPPKFGHLPLLMNSDGTKLSKRQGDIQISNYKENGIFPQALINFVISSGGGFNFEQGLKMKCYSMNELKEQVSYCLAQHLLDLPGMHSRHLTARAKFAAIPHKIIDTNKKKQFDINRVNAHSTRLMPEKLLDFNRLELINKLDDEETCKTLVHDVQHLLKRNFPEKYVSNKIK